MVVHLKSWVALVLAGMLCAGCSEGPSVGPQEPLSEADLNAIKDAVTKGAESYRDGHFDAFSKKFSDDGKLTTPNSPPRNGKPAIKGFARLSPKIDTLTVTNIAVDGSGKKATATATVTMTGKTNNSVTGKLTDAVTSTGTLSIDMKKKSGTWLAKDVEYVSP